MNSRHHQHDDSPDGNLSGYFVIADISGYTGFLAGNELAHAHGILAEISKLLIALFLAVMIYSTQDLSAQVIELNAFTGWQLNGKAKLYDGEFRISDAQNYGGKLA